MRPGIDVRGDGGYIVAPRSNHASGGQYRWREGHGPHEITPAGMPAWLLALVTRGNLEDANAEPAPVAEGAATPPAVLTDARAARALAAMRGLRVDDHKDGSRRLFAAASIAVRFDLDTGGALATIREYLNGAPTPREYSDADIHKRLQDAERTCPRGEALRNRQARRAATGNAPPPSGPPPEPFQPFPVDALPDRLRVFVEAVAVATGTDPAFAALAALVVVAGCIGNRVAALVKPGWTEPAVLWGVLVGRSGTTKSPVLKLVTRALVDLFKAEHRTFTEAIKEHQREVERHSVRLNEWKKSQRNGPPTDPPDEPESPTERRLLVSDITIEKLGCLLEENPLDCCLCATNWPRGSARLIATQPAARAATNRHGCRCTTRLPSPSIARVAREPTSWNALPCPWLAVSNRARSRASSAQPSVRPIAGARARGVSTGSARTLDR